MTTEELPAAKAGSFLRPEDFRTGLPELAMYGMRVMSEWEEILAGEHSEMIGLVAAPDPLHYFGCGSSTPLIGTSPKGKPLTSVLPAISVPGDADEIIGEMLSWPVTEEMVLNYPTVAAWAEPPWHLAWGCEPVPVAYRVWDLWPITTPDDYDFCARLERATSIALDDLYSEIGSAATVLHGQEDPAEWLEDGETIEQRMGYYKDLLERANVNYLSCCFLVDIDSHLGDRDRARWQLIKSRSRMAWSAVRSLYTDKQVFDDTEGWFSPWV